MNIVKNLPALTKILASLPGLHTYKKQMDAARKAGEPEAERAAIRAAETKWGNYLMKKFDVDLQVEGKENLPKEGPVVYVSNHQGFVDIPALCTALDTVQFGFIARENLKQVPLYNGMGAPCDLGRHQVYRRRVLPADLPGRHPRQGRPDGGFQGGLAQAGDQARRADHPGQHQRHLPVL